MLGKYGFHATSASVIVGAVAWLSACSSDETTASVAADSGLTDVLTDRSSPDSSADASPPDGGTDVSGALSSTAGTCGATKWNAAYGGSARSDMVSQEAGYAVAVDRTGNVFVTGTYVGGADFGGGVRPTGLKNPSLFLLKLDPTGAHVWSKGFGDPGAGLLYEPSVQGYAVAVDANSNVVVGGAMAGTVDFGGGALKSAGPPLPEGGLEALEEAGLGDSGLFGGCVTGVADCSPDAVVAKYDPAGNHLWSRNFGAEGGDTVRGVAFDAQGDVYLAGSFEVSMNVGGAALASAGKNDAWVAKLDPDGHHLWSIRLGGADDDAAEAIAVDSAGNAIVSGVYAGSVRFGTDTLASNGMFDAFVVKLDASNGNVLWAKKAGATEHAAVQGVVVDEQGAIAVAGHYRGSIDFGGGATQGIFADDGFVAKLDASGKPLWVKGFGGDGNDRVMAIALGPAGRLVAVGQTASTRGIDLGGGRIASGSGVWSAFAVELDAMSGHICSRSYQGPASAFGVAVDSKGNVIMTGQFSGILNLGLGPMASSGGTDIFVGAFAP
jgi:hypothetical protein